MKGMCHSLGARGGEEIGRCWTGEEGWSCVAASPRAPPGISRGPGKASGFSLKPVTELESGRTRAETAANSHSAAPL